MRSKLNVESIAVLYQLCKQDRLTSLVQHASYNIPVVPHKAVAEVSKIGHYRRGELL